MITLKLTPEKKEEIIKFFEPFKVESNNEYIVFSAKYEGLTLNIFENKKGVNKAVFSGEKELDYIKVFFPDYEVQEEKVKESKEAKKFFFEDFQIGSDEVGFGDFFGPIVVVACYYDEEIESIIKEAGIKDSKKMSDQKILEVVPKIINKVDYSLLIVENDKLNSLFAEGYNFNRIKAILHNQALYNMYLKHPYSLKYFVDKFCSEEKFYEYVKDQPNILFNITFEEKGESKFPSVALASVIARYKFLVYMQELGKKYNCEIPFGAGKKVDEFAKKFLDEHSIEELDKIVKKKFVNYGNLFKLF